MDTIYALSSGNPPAAIAVVRISGPRANCALFRLCGDLGEPRRAKLVSVRDPTSGEILDRGLALRFLGPDTATGEDVAELHLHGGRAVVRAVLSALSKLDGLREAEPGEFTRRAFENGRIDLAEAEGLADLLEAETESQRRAALSLAQGALSRLILRWQDQLLSLSARVEAMLDFADEGDVELEDLHCQPIENLIAEIDGQLGRPSVERLREGVRVVIAGPPNAGKSTLLNALIGRDAAITSDVPGTTRDVIEAPTAIAGIPFLFIDTAGLRESHDRIESIGVERARISVAAADLVLWLGDGDTPSTRERTIIVRSKRDLCSHGDEAADVNVSAISGEGLTELVTLVVDRARDLLPQEGEVSINSRHREALRDTVFALRSSLGEQDLILVSEHIRQARLALDRVTGAAGVENMLDALFGRFCIGK